jgi:cbb3-type cytochrome oxidase subunit 3
MNFIKIIILGLFLFFSAQTVFAENTEEKNIVDQAKEINEELKKKQAATEANIASEIGIDGEEPLPLNDPFAGDDASVSTFVSETSTESEAVNLSRYKLVAAFSGTLNEYATFVNETGEFITLELQEELFEDLILVEINIKEAVFQKADNGYISLNFKNQIRERDEF